MCPAVHLDISECVHGYGEEPHPCVLPRELVEEVNKLVAARTGVGLFRSDRSPGGVLTLP